MKDIKSHIKGEYGYKHFTGTIVADKREENGKYIVFDLVDGQQSVTSLILLLSVICRELRKSGKEREADGIKCKFIQDGDIEILNSN